MSILLYHLVQDAMHRMKNSVRLYRLLEANDFAGLRELCHAFYASTPHEWYTQQRHRALRGLLRERVLLVLRGGWGST